MGDFEDFWGEPISVYSRQMAISDGILVDINVVAKEICEQLFPDVSVAFTAAIWADVQKAIHDPKYGNDLLGVLWDILYMVRDPLTKAVKSGEDQVVFRVIITGIRRRTIQNYKAVIGFCDDGERLALTIMMPGED